jgi:hypothetical protein
MKCVESELGFKSAGLAELMWSADCLDNAMAVCIGAGL